ncbi:MAG: hypothetical protein IJ417_03815 [Bacteroidaceae bacterium]|nr:hypothetical protein [Bacteroidaceae bacterium]
MGGIKRYASHRLYAKNSECRQPCLVEIDATTHLFQRSIPLDGMEYPATEWLGGSFILSPIKLLDYTTSHKTLAEIIALLQDNTQSGDSHFVEINSQTYVWHTPTTQSQELVENIQRL